MKITSLSHQKYILFLKISYLCGMRVKQRITFALLLLANIFLLAHSVLPHSHHDGIVCFSLEELKHQTHCSGHYYDMDECCHNEHSEKTHHHATHEDCDLKEIVLRNDNGFHDDLIPCENCLSLFYTLYTLNEFYLEAPEFGKQLQLKPYLENYTPPFVGSIKSLRAPPASYFVA